MSSTSPAELVSEALRAERPGLDWRSGLAGATGIIGPVAIGLAAGESSTGLIAALGGTIGLCVPRAELGRGLWWGALAAAGGLGALAAAELATETAWSLALISFAWVAAWTLLGAAGPAGGGVAFMVSAVFVIHAGLPSPEPLGEELAWFACGAVVAVMLMALARRAARPSPLAGHDSALRVHALYLGTAVAAGSLLYRLVDMPHGYWVPLATLAILQPTATATRERSVQRAAGTLGGVVLIVAITSVTDAPAPLVACATVAAFLLCGYQERSNVWVMVLLTATVLLMIDSVAFAGDPVGFDRAIDSGIGIAIGLAFGELAGFLVRHRLS